MPDLRGEYMTIQFGDVTSPETLRKPGSEDDIFRPPVPFLRAAHSSSC